MIPNPIIDTNIPYIHNHIYFWCFTRENGIVYATKIASNQRTNKFQCMICSSAKTQLIVSIERKINDSLTSKNILVYIHHLWITSISHCR